MAIKIDDVIFSGSNVGISMPSDNSVDIDISRSDFIDCKKAIELRDPPTLIERIGLPAGTSPRLVIEALRALQSRPNASMDEKREILSKSALIHAVGATANLTTIYESLIQLGAPEFVSRVISILGGL